jgi:hypothetical protein
MAMVDIQLDNTTTVNYRGLREGNAFGFNFNISIDETPIDADAYEFTLTVYNNKKQALQVLDADWTKDGSTIENNWDSFPLCCGSYTFDLTWEDVAGNKVTIVPGTIEIIKRDGRN